MSSSLEQLAASPVSAANMHARTLRSSFAGCAARVAIIALAAVGLGGCDMIRSWFKPKPPEIKFAEYGTGYATKQDFAQIEHKLPLSTADLARITPDNLGALDQEQVDQIYARLTAGPIPDGAFDGKILLPRGTTGSFRIAEIAGGFAGMALHLKGLTGETIGEALWKGKVFHRDERVLRNRIEDLGFLRKVSLIEGEPRKLAVAGKETWLLFPAKLYCGQSLLDARRESIIIDYFFTDQIPGYQEKPDFLAGRRGLRVRDEIRMVRPGLYLGRAYMDKVFLLNFTLHSDDIAKRDGDAFARSGAVKEDCYTGTQQRVVTAGK